MFSCRVISTRTKIVLKQLRDFNSSTTEGFHDNKSGMGSIDVNAVCFIKTFKTHGHAQLHETGLDEE